MQEVFMAVPALKNEGFTYQDYQDWPETERWEIIKGIPFNMSPAPLIRHQNIVLNTAFALKNELGKECRTFIAPTDVVLDEENVVQPDVFAVCDRSIITEKNIQGVPLLIIEVLSPSTSVKDRRDKKRLYEKFGVQEYIIIMPEYHTVERYVLTKGKYASPDIFNWDEELPLFSFDLKIPLWEIFEKDKSENENLPLPPRAKEKNKKETEG